MNFIELVKNDFLKNPIAGLTLIAIAVTGYLAYRIGERQNEINQHIQQIEDSVELFAYSRPSTEPDHIAILLFNVGKTQLYFDEYSIDNKVTKLNYKQILPAGQQQNAWFVISVPILEQNPESIVKILLTDQLDRKWESIIHIKFIDNKKATVNVEKIRPL